MEKEEIRRKVLNIIKNKKSVILYGKSCIGKSRLCMDLLRENKYHRIECIRENGKEEEELALRSTFLSKSLFESREKNKCLWLDEAENVGYDTIKRMSEYSKKWKIPLLMTGREGTKVPNGVYRLYMVGKCVMNDGEKDAYYGTGYKVVERMLGMWSMERNRDRNKIEWKEPTRWMDDGNEEYVRGMLWDEYPKLTKGRLKRCVRSSELFSYLDRWTEYKNKTQRYEFGYLSRCMILNELGRILRGGGGDGKYRLTHYFPKCGLGKNSGSSVLMERGLKHHLLSWRVLSMDYVGVLRERKVGLCLGKYTDRVKEVCNGICKDVMEIEDREKDVNRKIKMNTRKIKVVTKEVGMCGEELKSGKRKGEKCGKRGKVEREGVWYCGVHIKKL